MFIQGKERNNKKQLKKIQKVVDKPNQVWYNIKCQGKWGKRNFLKKIKKTLTNKKSYVIIKT